jgi:hypothetical protein
MSAPRRARILAAYATVKINDPISGKPTVAGFYEGAVLPPEADLENVASLVQRDYAEWLDSDEAKAVDTAEAEAEKAQDDAAKQRADEADAALAKAEADRAPTEEPEVPVANGKPAQSAPKADWVAYAVSQRDEGVSEQDAQAEAEAMSKADLIAQYGG